MKLIQLCLAILLLLLTGFFYLRQTHHFRFVDEEDNFVFGKYLTRGEILYDDLITNHQPLTHILSSGVQKISDIKTTYLLISRHRQFMVVWSSAWSLLLVYCFGLEALLFILLFEISKIHILGNLFLAESQIVYPLIFLIGLTIFKPPKNSTLKQMIWGFCFGLTFFFLSPIWPVLAFLLILFLNQNRSHIFKSILLIAVGFLIPAFAVFHFSSIGGYLDYTFFTNLKYTVPQYQNEPWVLTVSKSFLTPLLAFLPASSTPTLWVIRIGVILFILNVIIKRKVNFKEVIVFFIALGLTNIRFVSPGTEGYSGFHFLPWYASFLFIVLMTNKLTYFKSLNTVFIGIMFLMILYFSKGGLFLKTDDLADYNINYSTHTSLGEAVRIMRGTDDTLFASSLAGLIYWQGDVGHLPKLYGYYTWMAGVPKLHRSVLEKLAKYPPTFFYCDCKGGELEKYLSKYTQVKIAGGSTNLYTLTDKINSLSNNQKDQLKYYKYSLDLYE